MIDLEKIKKIDSIIDALLFVAQSSKEYLIYYNNINNIEAKEKYDDEKVKNLAISIENLDSLIEKEWEIYSQSSSSSVNSA